MIYTFVNYPISMGLTAFLKRCRLHIDQLSAIRSACVLIFIVINIQVASRAGETDKKSGIGTRADIAINASQLSNEIDKLLAKGWEEESIVPAPLARDDEFIRRIYVDLGGRIPTESETRSFLKDTNPHKRRNIIASLLNSQAFVNHMTNVWKAILIPEASGDEDAKIFASDFEIWLRNQIARRVSYDKIVYDILTIPVEDGLAKFGSKSKQALKPTPFAFLVAKQGKPENLATSVSRLFLGLRLECAQCHDDPFKKWKREDLWGLAAFFSGIELQSNGDGIIRGADTSDRDEVVIPGTTRVIKATFIDGTRPAVIKGSRSRQTFSNWVTSHENPYFAKAAVNRIWAQFFGIGLVEPVDDMEADNVPSHPELLELLAKQFKANGFDLRHIMGAITLSRAYQLTSTDGSSRKEHYQMFDRMSIRGMTPIQLYDSLIVATNLKREPKYTTVFNSPKLYFLGKFDDQDTSRTEHKTTIHQALIMMNGTLVREATTAKIGKRLTAIANAPFLDVEGKIESLYLTTLARYPRPDEIQLFARHVQAAKLPEDALADVFWSLLCSAEFKFIR